MSLARSIEVTSIVETIKGGAGMEVVTEATDLVAAIAWKLQTIQFNSIHFISFSAV
jgi:hypothetical protein